MTERYDERDRGRRERPHGHYEIDLSRSRAPRAFRDRSNLWKDELRRIYRLLGRQVHAIESWEAEQRKSSKERVPSESLPHLSIAIFGPSGSGKSSLLRTLKDDVERKDKAVRESALDNDVAALSLMDPTTWRSTDQFLYAFLAAALELEQSRAKEREHGYPQGLSPVQLAFQEVNEYLRVVDEPEGKSDYDPLGLSLQKLERHTSGLRLRDALGTFIDRLADELGAKAVLLPVDDLDMSPDHLLESLQTYQSFLNHPRLIPVFAFTDRMPEELLENHFQRKLRERASEPEDEIGRLTMSVKMAVQFLARCFPVRNRIRLGPAPARVQRAQFILEPEHWRKTRDPENPPRMDVLELLLTSSFLLFGHPDNEDSHQVRASLRPSTLRRQFQVVDAMADCRIDALRVPQVAQLAGLDSRLVEEVGSFGRDWRVFDSEKNCEKWIEAVPTKPETGYTDSEGDFKYMRKFRLPELWNIFPGGPQKGANNPIWIGFWIPVLRLWGKEIGATWATLFNGAVWSLLNVHRDTLRELNLHLEDLYSWTPKELRGVIVARILAEDQATRRTVVDRWFNRTDYRRSQVLSLLAANIFRPWMNGEEPYGDEELPVRAFLEQERESSSSISVDADFPKDRSPDRDQILQRMTIPSIKGLLWFLNVTLGFYLPQIKARDWSDVFPLGQPVKGRMNGNGWDLRHAPITALRIADQKRNIFGFGMLFLNPTGYRHALEMAQIEQFISDYEQLDQAIQDNQNALGKLESKKRRSQKDKAEIEKRSAAGLALEATKEESAQNVQGWREQVQVWGGTSSGWPNYLLLRVWSCTGYSRGRYWATFSLWRGLGFIGEVLELAIKESESTEEALKELAAQDADPAQLLLGTRGFELNEETPKLVHLTSELKRLIRSHCLATLVPGSLLSQNSTEDMLLHGSPRWEPSSPGIQEAVQELAERLLGWLTLNWHHVIYPLPAGKTWLGWADCFIRRIHGEAILGGLWPRLNAAYLEEQARPEEWRRLAKCRSYKRTQEARETFETELVRDETVFRWSAAVAAGTWSDILLEYWRGCPPILELLLTCPAFFKNRERFAGIDQGKYREEVAIDHPRLRGATLGNHSNSVSWDLGLDRQEISRYKWLARLGLPLERWEHLQEADVIRPLVPDTLCIERATTDQFSAPTPTHVELGLKNSDIRESPKLEDKVSERAYKDDPAGYRLYELNPKDPDR
ncbi:MAG: hypothetical protein SX243_07840 [Acidobacteriota bacterium]|nr:hypothetical protein [Acidobacteriota bacterium]